MHSYAIRQVGTSNYLPEHGSNKYGYSRDNPEFNGGLYGPRLFKDKISAIRVISNWKQGEHYLQRSGGYDDYEETLLVKERPERKNIKLEIVEFYMSEVTVWEVK